MIVLSQPPFSRGRSQCFTRLTKRPFFFQVYIAEVSSARMRGRIGNINQLSINLGFLIAYSFGYQYDLPKTSLLPVGITLLNIILMVCFLPETPRWLVANDRRHDAILALHWLRGAKECKTKKNSVVCV